MLNGKPHSLMGGERRTFSNKGTESELTLQSIIGMLDYYRRNKESVAFEGTAFTPEWVKTLKISDFSVRAAFVGYTNPAHADQVLAFAKANHHDWINVWLKKDGGDETKIREWVTRQSERCAELKANAERSGFPFFDMSTMSFKEYLASAQNYLLGK